MGIVRLYSWLKRRDYKGVLRQAIPQYVSSLSLDANSILHKVAQIVYAYGEGENPERRKLVEKADPNILEAEYYQALATKLTEIVTLVNPKEILAIAIDGVASQAKIAQQRQRRFRSAIEKSASSIFDSSMISPGTEFMKRVDNFIQRWIFSAAKTLPPKIIYSSHMTPNEGEHKVLDFMRKGEITGNGSHVLYGMDADLIMLSMLSPLNKMFLMREDVRDVIDIDNLKIAISEQLNNSATAIPDFVIMIFLIGNDFLPHMPALEDLDESIETIMRTYNMYRQSLTSDMELNYQALVGFLIELAKEEPRLLELESHKEIKYPSTAMLAATNKLSTISDAGTGIQVTTQSRFDYNVFRGAWYNHIFQLRGNANIFAKLLPGVNLGVTTNKIVDLAINYLQGIYWIFEYYSKGFTYINTDWFYHHHYTPLISDLALVSKQLTAIEGYKAKPEMLIINPVHQLLAILPYRSRDLLPFEVQHLAEKDSPIGDLFPETAVLDREGKNTDWEGIVLIPSANMKRIQEAVNTTTIFTIERIEEFSPVNDIVIVRDPAELELDEKMRKFKTYLKTEVQKSTGRGRGRGAGRGSGRGTSGRGRGTGRGTTKF